MPLPRFAFAVVFCVLASLCQALGQPSPAKVTVGNLSITNDAAIFIADAKGYFTAEGLDVSLTTFRSASEMVPLLGTGQLDVGAGSPSAGLYNAILRGVKIRIVADKAHSAPGYSPLAILIRKDLIDEGKVRTFKDFKGRKFALTAAGTSTMTTLNTALKSVGLGYDDVETIGMSFSNQPVALANKAIDGALTAEPFATIAVERGIAAIFKRDDEIDPGHQLGAVLFSESFARDRADAAQRFLRAYVKGSRYYNLALKGGRIAGENADDVIAILARYTSIKEPALLRRITPAALHPDGRVNIDSLQRDFDFYASRGLIQGRLAVKDVVDEALLDAAVKSLSAGR